jgi:hypothetical protein
MVLRAKCPYCEYVGEHDEHYWAYLTLCSHKPENLDLLRDKWKKSKPIDRANYLERKLQIDPVDCPHDRGVTHREAVRGEGKATIFHCRVCNAQVAPSGRWVLVSHYSESRMPELPSTEMPQPD